MKMFFCNGKNDFCDRNGWCDGDCFHFNAEGGEDIEIPEGATRLWFFCFRLKKRLEALWYKIRRK